MEGLLDAPEGNLDATNPTLLQIKALTGLELTADQGAVGKIIGMLKNIAANLEASIAAEAVNEGDASGHYTTVLAEMNKTLSDLKEAKAALDAEIVKQ